MSSKQRVSTLYKTRVSNYNTLRNNVKRMFSPICDDDNIFVLLLFFLSSGIYKIDSCLFQRSVTGLRFIKTSHTLTTMNAKPLRIIKVNIINSSIRGLFSVVPLRINGTMMAKQPKKTVYIDAIRSVSLRCLSDNKIVISNKSKSKQT